MDDPQALEIGAHRGVEGLQDGGFGIVRPKSAQINLGRNMDFREISGPNSTRIGRRRSRSSRQRFARDGQFDGADGDHCVAVANLEHSAYAPTECGHFHRVADLDRTVAARNRPLHAPLDVGVFARQAIQLRVLIDDELFGALSRFTPRLVDRFGAARLELLDRALDFGARVEQEATRVVPRLAFGDAFTLPNCALASSDGS